MTVKTDRLVTLFGGGGFIGRYVAQALFRAGARVRIAERDPRDAFHLRPLAGLGQWQFMAADVTKPEQVAAAVAGAEAVVNLVGVFKGDLQAVHVGGPRHIGEAAVAAGVRTVVHVSALGADPDAESTYGHTKGEGELALRAAFPSATIVRPSIVFGMEDDFVNRFARMARRLPMVPVLRGSWRLAPVHAADLGRAVAMAALEPEKHAGKTYELAGPQTLSMRDVNRWICQATGHGRKPVVEVPDAIGRLIARLTGWLPGAPISWDQWLMLQRDSVPDGEHPGFEAFDIRPAPLAAVAEGWLPIYRRRGRWAKPSPY